MDKYNHEGYPDPTAAQAIVNIIKTAKTYKPLVYIASPFSGDAEYNVKKARDYCRFAVTMNCIPIAPHLHYPQFMHDSDKDERELGLFFAHVLLGHCDELWVFGDKLSNGMSREIEKAVKRGIPIKKFNSRCEEVC